MKTLLAVGPFRFETSSVTAVKFYSSQTAHELVFGGGAETWNNTCQAETDDSSFLSAHKRISATTALLCSLLPVVTVTTPPLFTLPGWPCWQAVIRSQPHADVLQRFSISVLVYCATRQSDCIYLKGISLFNFLTIWKIMEIKKPDDNLKNILGQNILRYQQKWSVINLFVLLYCDRTGPLWKRLLPAEKKPSTCCFIHFSLHFLMYEGRPWC